MNILSEYEVKSVESNTMSLDNISSWQLMERASEKLTREIEKLATSNNLFIVVGRGGNGGDGLAIARLASKRGFEVKVLMLYDLCECSDDLLHNFHTLPPCVEVFYSIDSFAPTLSSDGIVVDAIFGSGYKVRPYSPEILLAIIFINGVNRDNFMVVAIDIPSGMGCAIDDVAKVGIIADVTLTIYSPKLPMLLPSFGERAGRIVNCDIGYRFDGLCEVYNNYFYTTSIKKLIPKRKKFAHKGDFGSLLIIGAGIGMFGASIVAAKGAEAVGAGAITIFTPESYASAVYSNIPSAMTHIVDNLFFTEVPNNIDRYDVIAIGMGMGSEPETIEALTDLLIIATDNHQRLVIDADAINIIATNKQLMSLIPADSILTPHVGEFRRLVGRWDCEGDKLAKLVDFSCKYSCYVILKGAHSVLATPNGELHFNSTGTPALARAAAGDLLAGVVAGLMTQGLKTDDAAKIAMFTHGAAAEKAAEKFGERGATISRIIAEIY